MDYETLLTVQGYAKFFILVFVCIIFYGYAYSMYKRQKSGERDYEKYTSIVHDDSFDTQPLEERNEDNEDSSNREQKLEKGDR